MEMGQKIHELRTQKGLTLEELGNIVGVGKSTVRKWENGIIANMRRDKILKVSEALGVSPAYLMGWEEVDSRFTGKEASDDIYKKFKDNIERHHGKTKELLDIYGQLSEENKDKTLQYSQGLLSIQQMDQDLQLNAAHARTDIDVPEGTDTSDDDIMDDEDF